MRTLKKRIFAKSNVYNAKIQPLRSSHREFLPILQNSHMNFKQIILATLRDLKLFSKTEFFFLYGSVSRGEETPLSDIDICISLKLQPKERLRARMRLLANLPEKYDVTIFEDLPLYVQKEVFAGKLLYCKNKQKVIERALETIRDYEDFRPIYEYYIAKDKSKVEI